MISCPFFAILLCVKFLKAIDGVRLRVCLKILQYLKEKKNIGKVIKLCKYTIKCKNIL